MHVLLWGTRRLAVAEITRWGDGHTRVVAYAASRGGEPRAGVHLGPSASRFRRAKSVPLVAEKPEEKPKWFGSSWRSYRPVHNESDT